MKTFIALLVGAVAGWYAKDLWDMGFGPGDASDGSVVTQAEFTNYGRAGRGHTYACPDLLDPA